jgi:hypothetical protein
MANPNDLIPADFDPTGPTVTTFRENTREIIFYDINNFMNQNLLRSCKFAIRINRHPNVLSDYRGNELRQFTMLCDAVEFPGRSILTTDFNIPGRQKIRTPYKREFNEITLSFYHNTKFPIYEYFTSWVDSISFDSARTRYFNDIVTDISIFQFYDTTSSATSLLSVLGGARGADHVKYPQMTVKLLNAYPVSLASLPSNWADDGYHKISATFFYEETENSRIRSEFRTDLGSLNLKNLSVVDRPDLRNSAVTSIDQLLDENRSGLA